MYATDRYSFLKKVRFGRKGRVYRVLGFEYESDIEEKKFQEIFRFRRGDTIDECTWEAKFLRNPEASMWDFSKVDIKKLQKELDIAFIPPALGRRSEETGISPEQYILQAFWKGKMYHDIFKMSQQLNDKLMLELDFVLKVNTAAGRLLVSMEAEQGEIDFGEAWTRWEPIFKDVVKTELEKRKMGGPTVPDELPDVPPPAAPGGRAGAVTGAAPPQRPSESAGDIEEREEGGDDEGEAPPEPSDLAALREKLRAKKLGLKKK
jgi:hypothetical protein